MASGNIILPGIAQEIAGVIGCHAALHLIGQLPTCVAGKPGKQSTRVILYVPKRLKPGHRLVQILGMDRAQKLVTAFGGETLPVANCRHVYIRFRNREIRRMAAERMSTAEIAAIIGMTVRSVRAIKAE